MLMEMEFFSIDTDRINTKALNSSLNAVAVTRCQTFWLVATFLSISAGELFRSKS